MKNTLIALFLLCFTLTGMGDEISLPSITKAAGIYMNSLQPGCSMVNIDTLFSHEGTAVGYIFLYAPSGFLITPAFEFARPVYAYSKDSDFNLPFLQEITVKEIFSADLDGRLHSLENISDKTVESIKHEWKDFLSGISQTGHKKNIEFEQWPPEGTTPTGGWVITNWTQSAPYNNMCPMDLNAGSRSIAGCPAIAMGQILNYHREINETQFNSTDDYYHNFGAGNSYWIDDDYLIRDFPSFDTLNLWLDTLETIFNVNGTLSNTNKAALCFACGVAAKQVFSASVSGTYGMEQAATAYQRFGFAESRLVYPDDTTLNSLIAGNVKIALPVHLGLICSTGDCGHNVVVDGYNTDKYYHFNFGWGGSANGWYTLPPEDIPYSLTIIESALLDIKSEQYTSIPGTNRSVFGMTIYPNPVKDILVVELIGSKAIFTLSDLLGETILSNTLTNGKSTINLSDLTPGYYIYRYTDETGYSAAGKLIKE